MARLYRPRNQRYLRRSRRGSILVLAAFIMIAMLAMVAFAVDMGVLLVARAELQRAADAAAIAGAWQLADEAPPEELEEKARLVAQQYAAFNDVIQEGPEVELNEGNSTSGDIVVGTIDDLSDQNSHLYTGYPDRYNAVQVTVKRNSDINGKVPCFFARIFGIDGLDAEAKATAAIAKRIGGFRTPESGENLMILPIAIHEDTWNSLDDDSDAWAYNDDGTVSPGSDGSPELFLYPEDNNSPGNFGTVDVGSANNSTSHLSDQILNGISESDLDYHGGSLEFNDSGMLYLGGDTGISAGIKDEMGSIVSEKRVIPVYSEVNGPGNNAVYTIVKWVGVRIMDVDLTGGDKGIFVQPTNVILRGAITTETEGTSEYVYSPAIIAR